LKEELEKVIDTKMRETINSWGKRLVEAALKESSILG
jgi:hypothetical protein